MAEYIEREALLAAYNKAHVGPPGGARKLIEEAPTADVAPVVHGRWARKRISVPVYGGVELSCSLCGRIAAHEYNYCPNCGARMDGE